jgi:hypothetical protein
MRKWAKSSSSKEINVPRSPPSSSTMAWRNPPSRCMVSKLRIPYVRVICSKRKIGGIYNNISFVVVIFTFVDMIFARGCRLYNMFLSLSFLYAFHESHLYSLILRHIYLAEEHGRRIRDTIDLGPDVYDKSLLDE